MKKYPCTTQKEIRSHFWKDHPLFTKIPGYTQNDYQATVRCDFCDYVERLCRDGVISEALAKRATL